MASRWYKVYNYTKWRIAVNALILIATNCLDREEVISDDGDDISIA